MAEDSESEGVTMTSRPVVPFEGANVPGGQALQVLALIAPVEGEKKPAGHGMGDEVRSELQYAPAGQSSHAVVRPTTLEYAPRPQSTHELLPCALWKVPGGHGMGAVDVSELHAEPAGQTVHAVVRPSRLEKNPRPQLVHDVDLELPWKVPAGHVVATPLPAPGQRVPGGQSMHVCWLVAPSAVEYVPLGHELQSLMDVPPRSENVPAGHGVDTFAPALLYVPGCTRKHVALVVAPRASDAVPAEHGWQLACAVVENSQL